MSQGRSDDDRIALLEAQLSEMQVVLEAERQRHREESQAQASKLRLLELQVREQEDRKPHKTVHAPNLSRGGPRMVASTPRTSDNLFVALPSDSRPASRGSGSVTSSSTRTASKTGLRSARGHVGGSTDATATQRTVAKTPNASPERATAAATRSRTTALQHAWDKFCLAARGEFTTHELSLVSAETLQSLMDHYKVRSSIERAQIEGQWALLQEGKLSVGENATPKPGTTAKRAAVKRAVHTTPFDLRGELGKPHLSNRQLLGNEGVKPSNPNETTSTALVRSHSATVLLKPREPGPSNPNETQTHSEMKKLCFTRTVSPGPGRETPRGMRHVQPTESGEFTPRGIRTAGSTFMGGDEQRPHGVRCNIGGNQDGQTPRRGVRTYDSAQSPTRTHRPTIHVATPPHLDRVHLLTQTLAQNGAKRVERTTSHVERRTPFALGDN